MSKSILQKAGTSLGAYVKKLNPDRLRQLTLAIMGLCVVSFGVGLIFTPAGVILGGVSLLIMEWRMSDDE